MFRLKTTLALSFAFSIAASNFVFGMPTYTNDYGKGTTEIQYGDFKLSLPNNWIELDTSEYDSRMFSIMDSSDTVSGYVGLFSTEIEGFENNFDYPDSVLESVLYDAFMWSEPRKFEEYPILSDTQHGYFATSEEIINGDSVDSYALSFHYNGIGYFFFVNIYS